jgi:hypothetical protein
MGAALSSQRRLAVTTEEASYAWALQSVYDDVPPSLLRYREDGIFLHCGRAIRFVTDRRGLA